MNNEEQREQRRRQMNLPLEVTEQGVCHESIQAHRNGEGALTLREVTLRMFGKDGRNPAEDIAIIGAVGKKLESLGLLTNTGIDDDPAWAPTDHLLEMS